MVTFTKIASYKFARSLFVPLALGLTVGMSLAFHATSASAGVMRGSTSVTSTEPGNFGSSIQFTRDQSGLAATYTNGVTNFTTYTAATTHNRAPITNCFYDFRNGSSTVTYDLGAFYAIDAMAYWNMGPGTSDRTTGFTLTLDDDNTFATPLLTFATGTFTSTGSDSAMQANIFSFAATSNVRYARMTNFTGVGTVFAWGEVAFDEVQAAVPEPSTYALGLIGLAGLGLLAWRRRK